MGKSKAQRTLSTAVVAADSTAAKIRQLAKGERIARLYTQGSRIVGIDTRASVSDYMYRRVMASVGMFDDDALSYAYPASGTAYACTNYIGNKVASLPLRGYTLAGEPLTFSPLDTFMRSHNLLLRQCAVGLTIWGRIYLRKMRNADGFAPSLKWINPVLVREIPGRDGRIEKYAITDEDNRSIEEVDAREVVYAQNFDARTGGAGLSPYEVAMRYINVQLGIVTYSAAFFVNNATPDGIISFQDDPDDETIALLEGKIRAEFKGADNSHRTMFLPGGATYTAMQSDPKNTAQSETDERMVKHICSIFGVNSILVNMDASKDPLGATTTYNSIEVAFMRSVAVPLLEQTILPALNEQWAMIDFLDPYEIKVDVRKIPEFSESNLARAQVAGQLSLDGLVDDAEARELLGYDPQENYIKRDPAKLLTMLQAGTITLDLFGQMLGYLDRPIEGGNGNVVFVQGLPVPLPRIAEYANYVVDEMKMRAQTPPLGFGQAPTPPTIEPTPTQPLLPATTSAIDDPEQRADDDNSLCIALTMPKNTNLATLQRQVIEYCKAQGITGEWASTDSFHVTLAYAHDATDEQAAQVIAELSAIPAPKLELSVGSLKAFEGIGQYPVHFRIRRNNALLDYQRKCHDAMQRAGLDMSMFSNPDSYTPHITMGYVTAKPAAWTYKGSMAVTAPRMVIWHGHNDVAYECECVEVATLPEIVTPEPLTEEITPPVAIVKRAAVITELALNFTRNNEQHYLIREAARRLDALFIDLALPTPQWTNYEQWRYAIARMSGDLNSIASFIRDAQLGKQSVIDLWTDGYCIHDGVVYLKIAQSPQLAAFEASIAMDAESAGVIAGAPNDNGIYGIPLCALRELPDENIVQAITGMQSERLPLVAVSLSLYRDGVARSTWAFAGDSESQRNEIRAYAKKKRGANRDKPFNFEALRNHPATEWLNDAHEAGIGIDDATDLALSIIGNEWTPPARSSEYLRTIRNAGVFAQLSLEDTADDALSKDEISAIVRDMVTRAYPATRAQFVRDVYDIITRARASEVTARKFGGEMRALVRRTGLQVVYDAYAQVGNPIDSFTTDDVTLFRAWQLETSGYISTFGNELFKGNGITDNQVQLRADMWANKTLDDLYYTFLAHAAPKRMAMWVRDVRKESCRDCISFDGQVLPLEEWAKFAFPRDRKLECGGWLCGCALIDNETNQVLRAFIDEPFNYADLLEDIAHDHEEHNHESEVNENGASE